MAERRSALVVADAGPLIALSRVGLLQLINRYAASVLIPQAVMDEVQQGRHADAGPVLAAVVRGDFQVVPEPASALLIDPPLDIGEVAVIRLALARNAEVLMDETAGRAASRRLGLPVIGTLGLLVLARQEGWIPRLAPLLRRLAAGGHYLSEPLITEALRVVDETE